MTDEKCSCKKNKVERVLNGDVTKLVKMQKDLVKRLEKIIFDLKSLSA